jgi:hypothetical protein
MDRLLVSTLALTLAACTGERTQVVTFPRQPSAMPSEPGPGTPAVHIESADGTSATEVELRELVGLELTPYNAQTPGLAATGYRAHAVGRRVCTAPCEAIVDGRGGREFYFAGEGITESRRFSLAGESGTLRFTVSPGHEASANIGLPLTGVSGATVFVGGFVLGFGLYSRSDGAPKVGAGLLVGGGVALGVGLVLLLSGRTTFTITRQPAPAR